MSETKSLIGSEKDRLYAQLLGLIDRELLGHGKEPVKEYKVIYYKDEVPEDHSGKTIVLTAIPEPNLPIQKEKNETENRT